MNREAKVKLHAAAGFLALSCIALFWISTVVAELFLSRGAIATVKQAICYALFAFVPLVAATGGSGFSLGGKSKHPLIAAKRKRMPFIGAVGVLLLIPSAIFLNHRAQAGRFDAVFYAVQALELLGGLTNLALMGLNIRDGLAIRRHQV